MEYFDTSLDPADHSHALFVVSDTWWWFIAVGIPLSVLVMIVTWGSVWWSTKQVDKQAEERRKSDGSDLEKLLSYEMGTSTEHKRMDSDDVAP